MSQYHGAAFRGLRAVTCNVTLCAGGGGVSKQIRIAIVTVTPPFVVVDSEHRLLFGDILIRKEDGKAKMFLPGIYRVIESARSSRTNQWQVQIELASSWHSTFETAKIRKCA